MHYTTILSLDREVFSTTPSTGSYPGCDTFGIETLEVCEVGGLGPLGSPSRQKENPGISKKLGEGSLEEGTTMANNT